MSFYESRYNKVFRVFEESHNRGHLVVDNEHHIRNNPEKYCKGNYTPKNNKKEFMKEQNNKCAICECEPIWNGKPLVFVLDHIDGDASNNRRDNLRMICPNCDSQLPTFKSKNKNSTRRNYWREHIIKQLSEIDYPKDL